MTPDLKVLIPTMRKIIPQMIAEDIVGVQPMSEDIGEVFQVRHVSWVINCYGDIIHNFIFGYQWFNGEEWGCVDGEFCHVKYDDDIRTKDSGIILMERNKS